MYVITEIIIEMVRMSCLREEYGEFMQWLCIFGVVIIIELPHPFYEVSRSGVCGMNKFLP